MTTDARYERSRAAVFDAVRSVLVAQGVAGLTADHIAEESGVSRSTIYRNWPNLAALTCEVFDELMHRDTAAFADEPAAALREYLADYARRLNDATYCAVLIAGSSHLSGVFGCWRFTRPCGSRCGALCAVRSLPGCGTRIRRA